MAQTKPPNGSNIRITVSPMTEPFWQGTRERKLLAGKCISCERVRMPFLAFCPACNAQQIKWIELRGPATIYSFTFYPHPDRTSAADDSMLAPVVVEFDDAPEIRYAGNLTDIDSADIRIGMQVELDWIFNADGWGLPIFRQVS